MLKALRDKARQALSIEEAQAHCDIPCGIYDTGPALIAALTVVRMIDIIDGLVANKPACEAEYQNKLGRAIAEKEKHAEIVKHEIRVIWGDYFKAPQFEKFPKTNELVHSIMLQGSKVRQGASREEAVKLVELVNEFAEIFWETKGVESKRAICPYEPKLETVYPVL
ncbi:MAG: superoxide dismutase, Ni [Planctomycetota bacterium]|nr:MAG: superoxide dismutase, Ni [Planctomycetota bacterium]